MIRVLTGGTNANAFPFTAIILCPFVSAHFILGESRCLPLLADIGQVQSPDSWPIWDRSSARTPMGPSFEAAAESASSVQPEMNRKRLAILALALLPYAPLRAQAVIAGVDSGRP